MEKDTGGILKLENFRRDQKEGPVYKRAGKI